MRRKLTVTLASAVALAAAGVLVARAALSPRLPPPPPSVPGHPIPYLEEPERSAWQRPDEVVRALGLTGAEKVVDVGAGNGYFTFRLARALPRGKVVASEVDPEFARYLRDRSRAERLANVEPALIDAADPGVPPDADLVFLCDVLHLVQGRAAWVRRLYDEMRPGARRAVIQFQQGKAAASLPDFLKAPKDRLLALLQDAGFELREDRSELLANQAFLLLEKPRRAP